MNEKNELLQDNDSNKLTKVLVIGAGIFIIFVIVVVIYKFVSGDNTSKTKVILPPEIKQDTALFKSVAIGDNLDNTSDDTSTKNDTTTNDKTQNPVTENVVIPEKTNEVVTKTTQAKKEKTIIKKEVPIKTEESTPKVILTTQKTEPKKVKVVVKKQVNKHKKVIKVGHYYIQVAALIRNKPSKKFLAIIKKHQFNYKIIEVKIHLNGKDLKVKKVLIGPYKNHSEARKYLKKVKKDISSGAFILKV